MALANADGNIHLSFVSQSLGRPRRPGNPARRALPVGLQTCIVAAKALTLIALPAFSSSASLSDEETNAPFCHGETDEAVKYRVLCRGGYFHFLLVAVAQ